MVMAKALVILLFMGASCLPLPLCKAGSEEVEVRGMLVFGSSLVDNGNNNFLRNSKARANYPPYGIDFPLGPSGRFSNGRNPVDVLGELLKLPSLIPPFADPRTKGRRIVHGVNYASGGSGILDQTGSMTHITSGRDSWLWKVETLFGAINRAVFSAGMITSFPLPICYEFPYRIDHRERAAVWNDNCIK